MSKRGNTYVHYTFINCNFEQPCGSTKRRKKVRFVFDSVQIISKPGKETTMFELTIKTNQAAIFPITPKGPAGELEPLDGPAVAKIVSGIGQVRIIDDKLYIIPGDEPGDLTVEVSGDAQEGSEVQVLSETIVVHVQHVNATSILDTSSPSIVPKDSLPPAEVAPVGDPAPVAP